jgi:hypothetical protein
MDKNIAFSRCRSANRKVCRIRTLDILEISGRRIAASTVELLNSKPYVASGSTIRGGHIFIHLMLLEYFADLPAQHTSVKH